LDGRWRAVDGRELYAHQKPAGNLYQAALRAELAARLGVEWAPVDVNGQADIVGVPEDLCRHFSSRRREIEAAAAVRVATAEARLGRSLTPDELAEAFQVATLATRPAKGRDAEATESLVECQPSRNSLTLPSRNSLARREADVYYSMATPSCRVRGCRSERSSPDRTVALKRPRSRPTTTAFVPRRRVTIQQRPSRSPSWSSWSTSTLIWLRSGRPTRDGRHVGEQ